MSGRAAFGQQIGTGSLVRSLETVGIDHGLLRFNERNRANAVKEAPTAYVVL